MKLNELISQANELKAQRKELSERDRELSAALSAVEGQIMQLMLDIGTTRASNDAGNSVHLNQVARPTIMDWDLFYKHLQETGEFDLLQKRLSVTACRDRWDNQATIPGVQPAVDWELSYSNKRT